MSARERKREKEGRRRGKKRSRKRGRDGEKERKGGIWEKWRRKRKG